MVASAFLTLSRLLGDDAENSKRLITFDDSCVVLPAAAAQKSIW